eukprot:COSAG05_NODE_506_length_9178_cov_36.187576_8_plen_163_part_00
MSDKCSPAPPVLVVQAQPKPAFQRLSAGGQREERDLERAPVAACERGLQGVVAVGYELGPEDAVGLKACLADDCLAHASPFIVVLRWGSYRTHTHTHNAANTAVVQQERGNALSASAHVKMNPGMQVLCRQCVKKKMVKKEEAEEEEEEEEGTGVQCGGLTS